MAYNPVILDWSSKDKIDHPFFYSSYTNTFMRADVYFLGIMFGIFVAKVSNKRKEVLLFCMLDIESFFLKIYVYNF